MSNLIRTANGRMLDMEQIRLANEKEIALGNMGVNARGDVINDKKEIVTPRNQRVKEHYQLHSTVPTREPYKKVKAETSTAPHKSLADNLADTPSPLLRK